MKTKATIILKLISLAVNKNPKNKHDNTMCIYNFMQSSVFRNEWGFTHNKEW